MRLLLTLCLLLSLPAAAETILIPLEQQGISSLPLPAPGSSQRRVLEEFGLPDRQHPPVGTPKMSRWDYRDFSVYFENERVITSVRQHQPRFPQTQSAQEQP
jgi:hypothetical protein